MGSSGARDGDLTTASGWDQLWRLRFGGQGRRGVRDLVRARLPWVRANDAVLGSIVDRAASGRTIDVLELGCAPGTMLARLHALRPAHRYGGLDIAEEGLAVAAARLSALGITASLRLGDLRVADPGERADLVVSFGLVEHFLDPVEIVRGHARFVRPGGHVAITVPNYAHPAVAWLLEQFSPETLATHNLDVMSQAALARALAGSGLIDVETGAATGPVLPSSRPVPGWRGAGYKIGARAWNLIAPSIPGAGPALWDGLLWGMGRHP